MKRWTINGMQYKQDENGKVWYRHSDDWYPSSRKAPGGRRASISDAILGADDTDPVRKPAINIGDIYESHSDGPYTIIDIVAGKVVVEFPSGYTKAVEPATARHGRIKDRLKPSVFGVGCMGDGPHKGKTKPHTCWTTMLRRCYKPDPRQYENKFEGVTVCTEWLNYQNFAEWYIANCDGEHGMIAELIGGKEFNPGSTKLVVSQMQLRAAKKSPSRRRRKPAEARGLKCPEETPIY
jgi:hypothetical protein